MEFFCTLIKSEIEYSNVTFRNIEVKLKKDKFFHKRLFFRIQDRAFRNGTLEWNNAKDSIQVMLNPSQCEGFGT